jgi:hypothetical protein
MGNQMKINDMTFKSDEGWRRRTPGRRAGFLASPAMVNYAPRF